MAWVIVVAVLSILDGCTTWKILRGGGYEINPVLRALISRIGLPLALAISRGLIIGAVFAWPQYANVLAAIYAAVVWHNIRQIMKRKER